MWCRLLSALLLGLGASGCLEETEPSPVEPSSPAEYARAPLSCAFACPHGCGESEFPYFCPSLAPYDHIPHADTCLPWDGGVPPVVSGKCVATEPTGEAARYAGTEPDRPSVTVLPSGRRLTPAGATWEFTPGKGMTSQLVAVPGTQLVLTVDTGYGPHVVRAVDTTLIGKGDPVVGQVEVAAPDALNQGLAFSPPDRVFVATAGGRVQALQLDVATGALKRDDARSIFVPPAPGAPPGAAPYYVAGVAVSHDGSRLFISGVEDDRFLVADITPGGPAYGTLLGTAPLGRAQTYGCYVDPHDPGASLVYVTMWAGDSVREVDVSNPAAPRVNRAFFVGKDPEGLAFLDARWMIVGNDLSDSFSLIDRSSGFIFSVPIDSTGELHGSEPSSLVYDEASKRLYVTHAGLDALAAYDVDLSFDPPRIDPVGRLPTLWWPSGVALLPGGALAVTSLMGRGTGPRQPAQQYDLLHGGIQRIEAPGAADLVSGEAAVQENLAVAGQPGRAEVLCPAGVADFPVPPTNTGARSPVIDHVFVIVRENKSFDGLLGDFPGVRGEPSFTLIPSPLMSSVWPNLRALSARFALGDNFYTSAFVSDQGHLWTTHGRSDDYDERTWPMNGYGRNLRPALEAAGVAEVGRPEEGSLFDWLGDNQIPYDVLGESFGSPRAPLAGTSPVDEGYPGGTALSVGHPDVEKACHVAGRLRVRCDLGNVTYLTLPNDHTLGVATDKASPLTMYAVNDEATGLLVDAITHSPLWPRSLVILTEDDSAQGGESVDYHRTLFELISPWVKRGYVSHGHIDMASLHKIIAHVFALPYPNLQVERAAIPFDMFSATPDYVPYEQEARRWPLECSGPVTAAEERLTASWDMSRADAQPGLEAQIDRWLHGNQLVELPAEIEEEMAARASRGAGGEEE